MRRIVRCARAAIIAALIFATASSDAAVKGRSSGILPQKITLSGEEYDRLSLLNAFLGVAFEHYSGERPDEYRSMPESRRTIFPLSPYAANDFLWRSTLELFATGEFRQQYPWLYEYIFRDNGTPRTLALNKWKQPVKVSVGYPFDLKAVVSGVNEFVDYEEARLQEGKEATVAYEVNALAPVLRDLTDLSVTYIPHKNETSSIFANVRIIFTDAAYFETPFKKGERTWSRAYARNLGPPARFFRTEVEPLLTTKVKFTDALKDQVDGYFLANANNEIELSFCFIADKPEDSLVRGLIRECLVRSMGLPEEQLTAKGSLLSRWTSVQPYPGFTDFDRYMLWILYNPRLKPGMS